MKTPELAKGGQAARLPTVKSADRAVVILEYLGDASTPRSLREVTEDLGFPRASTYAILTTLQRRGWVELANGRYRLGIRSLRTSAHFLEHDETVANVSPTLDALCAELSETIHLARLDGNEVVYLVTRRSPHSVSIIVPPGRRMPAYVTGLGKALLAARVWSDVEALLPRKLTRLTKNTISSRDELHRELQATEERGYALDREESADGVRCVAIALAFTIPRSMRSAAQSPRCA